MGLASSRAYADMNGRRFALDRLKDGSQSELEEAAKSPTITQWFEENIFFGIPFSEKALDRYYNRIVAKKLLKQEPRDKILYPFS